MSLRSLLAVPKRKFLVLACALAACAAPTDADEEIEESVAEGLTASTVTSFAVDVVGTIPGGIACARPPRWVVDFGTRHIEGDSCVEGRPGAVDRELTTAEIATLRRALAGVRTTTRSGSCPPDGRRTSLRVERPSGTYAYADKRSVCAASPRPVTNASIDALVARLEALSVAAGRIVLFGDPVGTSGSDQRVWEFDGHAWTPRTPATVSPSILIDTAMASRAGSVVLFGGVTASGIQGPETVEWDGHDWVVKATSGPSPRRSHAMATLGTKVVLFGGFDGNRYLGDTWEWDGATWMLKATSGPSPRSGHAMATLDGKVVLFGGNSGRDDETWEWDGVSWTQRSPSTKPFGRFHPALATLNGKVVLFGGVITEQWYQFGQTVWRERSLADTWEWDGDTWTERSTPGPSPRATAMAALEDKIVLFGGANRADTWLWDGSTWTEAHVDGPTSRNRHAVALLP